MPAPCATVAATKLLFSLHLSIVVLLTHVLHVDTLFLRAADPRLKVGEKVQLTSSAKEYSDLCVAVGLMPMLKAGSKGVIYELDLDGHGGSVGMKTDAGDKAWVPIKALHGFRQWTKDGTTTTKAPTPPAPAPSALVVAPAPAPGGAPAPGPFSKMPTEYYYHGCQRSGEIDAKDAYTPYDGYGMKIFKCFQHCKKKQDAKYFAITGGAHCFCSALEPGSTISSGNCDTACSGDPREICGGGKRASSVYTMLNSSPPPFSVRAAAKNVQLSGMYGFFEGQSCGEASDNLCEINSATKFAGTALECKLACWYGFGAEQCNGFTYDSAQSKCTFLQDVTDGEVVKKKELTCFFKKVGFPDVFPDWFGKK